MRTLLRRRPSPAMVVACIALLVALSGTGIAAVAALPNASVGTAQLKNNAVTTAKVRNNTITSAKVRNASLLRADFRPGQIPAGAKGAKGDKGDKGDAGAAGAAGVIGAISVRTNTVLVDGGAAHNGAYSTRSISRNCDADEKAISAGTGWSDDANDLELFTGRITPVLNGQNQVIGFRGVGGNDSGNDSTFTLYVLCYKG